ncbi:MAG: protein BatD [Chitinivibrionales bacterium]|nr:protein BatD [Chitinivibrionales bacterium]
MKQALFFLLCVALSSYPEIKFSVTTENNQVIVGEQALISATVISSSELSNIAAPQFPESQLYTVFKKSQNSSQSSSIQIINGAMRQTVEITYNFYYYLSFLKEGICTIPALTFTSQGQTFTSQPFQIHVTTAAAEAKSGEISVSLIPNKKQFFIGEQGVLTLEIAKKESAPVEFTNQSFLTILAQIERNFGASFSTNRLFTDKIGQSRKPINGVVYEVYTLAYSIIPLNSGTYAIQPVSFDYFQLRQVRRQARDPFQDFFGSSIFDNQVQQIPKAAVSNQLQIMVKPLPAQPPHFTGIVGQCHLTASVNSQSVPVGEPVTLTVQLNGSTRPGNLSDIQMPAMEDFDVFTPEKQIFIDTTTNGIATRKKYKYLLIPKKEGELTIPSIQMSYFDPQDATYKTTATQVQRLTITKSSKSSSQQTTRYLTQEDIREVGQDIRYIKTTSRLKQQSSSFYTPFFILYPIPFIVALFAFLYRIQSSALRNDPTLQLRKQAFSRSLAILKRCKKEFDSKSITQNLATVQDGIEQYISNRFGFSAAGKTLDQLKIELVEKRVDLSTTDKLIPLLETIDRYRFAGMQPEKSACMALLDQTIALIKKLENKEKVS